MPVFIAIALVLVVVQPRLNARLERRAGSRPHEHGPLVPALVYATGVYGGYFGAAQGILLLGILGIALLGATVASLCKYLGKRSAVLLSAWTSAAMFAEALFGPQTAGLVVVAAALFLTADAARPGDGAASADTHHDRRTTETGTNND